MTGDAPAPWLVEELERSRRRDRELRIEADPRPVPILCDWCLRRLCECRCSTDDEDRSVDYMTEDI